MPAIGIDVGTSSCRVAVSLNGKVTVIENKIGKRKTPSYVTFTKDKRIIGEEAAHNAVSDPTNTVFGVKRIIGRVCQDRIFQNFKDDDRGFSITEKEGRPVFLANVRGREGSSPEDIVTILLTRMKKIAEWSLGKTVTGAVITVPASFSETQRRKIGISAEQAGINVLQLINETTAVAVAHANSIVNNKAPKHEKERKTMILQLGAGTTSAAVVRIKDHTVDVLSSVAINNLGGDDFDKRIMSYCIEQQIKRHGHSHTENDIDTKAKLRKACMEAKEGLTLLSRKKIEVKSPSKGCMEDITREIFERETYPLLKIVLDVVHMTMMKANIKEEQIDDVVVAGGLTRILKVLDGFSEHFNPFEKKRNKRLNEDEAAVIGAAIRAEHLSSGHSEENRIAVNEFVSERRFIGISEAEFLKQEEGQITQFDELVRKSNNFCRDQNLYLELTTSTSISRTIDWESDESDESELAAKRIEKDAQRDLETEKLEEEINELAKFALGLKCIVQSLSESVNKCEKTVEWILHQENKTLEELLGRRDDLKSGVTNALSQIDLLRKLKGSDGHKHQEQKGVSTDFDSPVERAVERMIADKDPRIMKRYPEIFHQAENEEAVSPKQGCVDKKRKKVKK